MIKGVNRQMIEVLDTGNVYFERALLVVRPECADTESSRLHEEARQFLRKAGSYAALRRRRRERFFKLCLYVVLCGSGILFGMLLTGVFWGL